VHLIPILSGCGALPCFESCRNFSRLIGRNFLIAEKRLLPVKGRIAGAGCCVSLIVIFTSFVKLTTIKIKQGYEL